MLWFLLACAHKVASIDPDLLPVLPPPRVTSYAHVVARPRDPLVARLIEGLPWEASLSGAAAGVALQLVRGEPVGPRTVAWRAVLAGYPWPVDVAERELTAPGQPPERLGALARELAQVPGRDIGLVRARGAEGDVWILLSAVRRMELPEIPREASLDDVLAEIGAEARVFPPGGGPARALPARLDAVGEWLLEIEHGGEIVTRLPIQVGGRAEEAPPIADREPTAGDAGEVAQEFVLDVRARYQHGDWADDSMLQSVARALLRRAEAGPVDDLADTVRAAGFIGVDVAGATCTAADVPTCLDQIWWSGRGRAVLVGDWPHLAVAASDGPRGVTLVVLGAG